MRILLRKREKVVLLPGATQLRYPTVGMRKLLFEIKRGMDLRIRGSESLILFTPRTTCDSNDDGEIGSKDSAKERQ